MGRTARRFLVVTVLVAVGLAIVGTVVASTLVGDNVARIRAVATSVVVGLFVALILLARRRDDFEVESAERRPQGVMEEGFVAEAVESGDDTRRP